MSTTSTSLLAHLASRLTGRTETLATEALGYILSYSNAARAALSHTVSTETHDVGAIERVKTEVTGEDGERVDLVGLDAQGTERVLIEAKFWAGLTDHQPNTYIERLKRGSDGSNASVLLFVAPELRLETLWREVLGRVSEGVLEESGPQQVTPRHCARINDGPHHLMLTSWTRLLGRMTSQASEDGDTAAERDLQQLLALCEREDSTAFLPLRSDEFGPEIPRRLLNLQQLIDDATERACADGFAATKGLNVTPQKYGYGRYIRLGKDDGGWAEAWFGVNYRRWATERDTPVWLHFTGTGNTCLSLPEIRARLGLDYFYIPLPVGVEYNSVLDAVLENLKWLAESLGGGATQQ